MKSKFLTFFCFAMISVSAQEIAATGSRLGIEDAKDALALHNQVRKDVGTAPLTWSAELSKYAQDWADQLANRNCAFEHRSTGNYGENIYMASGTLATAKQASANWYSEIKTFKNVPLNSNNWYDTGHYTQMVWKSTQKVGMGISKCTNGNYIVVANYDPPGNFMGQTPY
ncbi:hypothetical protein ASG01_04795 [Chryseobacterium sp. Leaf180]|jgi:uncharacterized protein YkwD|uniref:CAP family protein n=1 Tax=Chryseobacterium sp. Leaf180 TaxID=1736289 RepID=UPI0006F241D2|nr:CAP family protein [Chryseobacterium sp. Leaf180]KQR95173.1 hypothetical protein ASG01_04795 [Chryseobacterium sp. Leaf180]